MSRIPKQFLLLGIGREAYHEIPFPPPKRGVPPRVPHVPGAEPTEAEYESESEYAERVRKWNAERRAQRL